MMFSWLTEKRYSGHESGPGRQDREIFTDRRENPRLRRRRGLKACWCDRDVHAHRVAGSRSARNSCLHFCPDRRRRESEGRRLLSFELASVSRELIDKFSISALRVGIGQEWPVGSHSRTLLVLRQSVRQCGRTFFCRRTQTNNVR
jgi:hypothetical protein